MLMICIALASFNALSRLPRPHKIEILYETYFFLLRFHLIIEQSQLITFDVITDRSKAVLLLWFTISFIVSLHVCPGISFFFFFFFFFFE